MTKRPEDPAGRRGGGRDAGAPCPWCGRPVAVSTGPGRPRRYCRASCRQAAYLARRLAVEHGLSEGEVVVGRAELEDLQGALYCLRSAIEDVERDLEADRSAVAVSDALRWLLDNARPLAALWLEPRQSAAGARDPEARP